MQGNLGLAQTEAEIALLLDRESFAGNYARALIAQASGDSQQANQTLDNPNIINNLSLRQFVAQFKEQGISGQTLH